MKLGVKIGPEKWHQVLEDSQAKYCEVWFRLDYAPQLTPVFEYLRSHSIHFGLHFWAVLPSGYEPNLAYQSGGIADQSQKLIAQTLSLAYQFGAQYVNIHPGSLVLKKLDLDHQTMALATEPAISSQQALESLLTQTQKLKMLADKLGLLFLVETLPKNDAHHWRDQTGRLTTLPAQNISPDLILKLAQSGISITNDFGHLAASWENELSNQLWPKVFSISQQLAPYTKLIHLNTVAPPFNGTDSHGGVLDSDFSSSVFPNRHQILELLRLFKGRNDVWLIPEPPAEVMVQNYQAIKTLLQEV